ncbi:hypothetical protein V8G54_034986 [Vigna mungo]|uniref:Aminotransferase-like plant mobile domain-containing protein n=1 Tax=Vigna mungo TaxID=3915 RepID=A0AAQ3RE28_VIGMU
MRQPINIRSGSKVRYVSLTLQTSKFLLQVPPPMSRLKATERLKVTERSRLKAREHSTRFTHWKVVKEKAEETQMVTTRNMDEQQNTRYLIAQLQAQMQTHTQTMQEQLQGQAQPLASQSLFHVEPARVLVVVLAWFVPVLACVLPDLWCSTIRPCFLWSPFGFLQLALGPTTNLYDVTLPLLMPESCGLLSCLRFGPLGCLQSGQRGEVPAKGTPTLKPRAPPFIFPKFSTFPVISGDCVRRSGDCVRRCGTCGCVLHGGRVSVGVCGLAVAACSLSVRWVCAAIRFVSAVYERLVFIAYCVDFLEKKTDLNGCRTSVDGYRHPFQGQTVVDILLVERVLEDKALEDKGLARRRPTASTRRGWAPPIQDDPIVEDRVFEEEAYQAYEGPVQEEAFEASDDDYEEEEHDVPDIQEEDVGGFPGGPRDASLLTHYVQRVAYGISQGRNRGDMLKLILHGIKVNKLGPCAEGIQHIVLNSSLMPLTQICYDYVDKGLLLGFIERWHFETSNFHLPMGEMTITLDDVSTLLHLPVLGQFCDLEELEFEEARTTLVDLLGVDGGTTGAEMEDARGTKVRLSWLRDIYVQRCWSQDWDYAARAYLLHLAWGVAALAHLYEQLGDASLASTKQMAGYLTLFQIWIYEHFPRMGRRRLVSSYDDTIPQIWEQLDGLTYSGVVWHPYKGHQGIRQLLGVCMYSGWIWIGDTLSRHFPERVMKQFGFYQEIPRPPTVVADADVVVVDFANVRQASYPSECVDGYIQWFTMVSHPYIITAPADARPPLALTQHPDVPQEARPHRRSSPPSPFGALAMVELLEDANDGIDEYSPTRRGQRHVRGRRSTSN